MLIFMQEPAETVTSFSQPSMLAGPAHHDEPAIGGREAQAAVRSITGVMIHEQVNVLLERAPKITRHADVIAFDFPNVA
jgi:hypothetical protein